MARITLRQLLDHAAEHGYGVPAFNINNMEQGLAIMDAAAAVDAPVIIQASRGARSYAHDIMLAKMIDALEEMYPQIPLCLHQDHGNEESTCATALQHGFTSVMMDGSLKADAKTAASYEYNIDITRRVVDMAHWIGASVEGELGVLGSLEHGGGSAREQSRLPNRPPGCRGRSAGRFRPAPMPCRAQARRRRIPLSGSPSHRSSRDLRTRARTSDPIRAPCDKALAPPRFPRSVERETTLGHARSSRTPPSCAYSASQAAAAQRRRSCRA